MANGFRDYMDTFAILDPFINSTDERNEASEQERATELWDQALESNPSTYDLQGLSLYEGGVPQEYLDAYAAENTRFDVDSPQFARRLERNPGFADRLAREREGLDTEARQQWVQEQLRKDPLFGLGVNKNSALAGTRADQGAIDAQMRALGQMQGIYNAGGYTDAERAQMQMLQRDAALGEQQQRAAVQQQMAMRGMGGSGAEMMGALAAQQGGANRANDWANQTAIAAQQRALQALQQSGTWAGQVRGQSFQEGATRNAAADAWNQYQTGIRQQRQTDAGNAAQQAYQNQLQATAGATGQYNANAAYWGDKADEDGEQRRESVNTAANMIGSVFGGGGGSSGGGGGS